MVVRSRPVKLPWPKACKHLPPTWSEPQTRQLKVVIPGDAFDAHSRSILINQHISEFSSMEKVYMSTIRRTKVPQFLYKITHTLTAIKL
jgi:hypothetical protein